jgi:uncharacterized membrane protein
MTAILGLCLLVVALLVIVGAKNAAGQIAKGAVGAALIFIVISCAIQSCTCFLSQTGNGGSLHSLVFPLLAIGYIVAAVFFIYRRYGRVSRERRVKDLERARDAERARIYPPDDTEDSDGR